MKKLLVLLVTLVALVATVSLATAHVYEFIPGGGWNYIMPGDHLVNHSGSVYMNCVFNAAVGEVGTVSVNGTTYWIHIPTGHGLGGSYFLPIDQTARFENLFGACQVVDQAMFPVEHILNRVYIPVVGGN